MKKKMKIIIKVKNKMSILIDNDIGYLIFNKISCCRKHLFLYKLVSKKINNYVINLQSYYKILNKLTENELLSCIVDFKSLNEKFYNINTQLFNISGYNLHNNYDFGVNSDENDDDEGIEITEGSTDDISDIDEIP